jgi:hypothetical protein
MNAAPPQLPEVDMQRGQDQRTGRHPQGHRDREWTRTASAPECCFSFCVSEFGLHGCFLRAFSSDRSLKDECIQFYLTREWIGTIK